jgi:hypothetical protein
MTDYIRPLLRICILFALVFTAVLLAKPARASAAAFQDCCTTCQNRYATCLSGCTTQICRLGCQRQLDTCIEVCPACLVE